MIFGSHELPEHELTDAHLADVLARRGDEERPRRGAHNCCGGVRRTVQSVQLVYRLSVLRGFARLGSAARSRRQDDNELSPCVSFAQCFALCAVSLAFGLHAD